MRSTRVGICVLLLLCSAAAADTLYLKGGGTFEGKLVEKTATHYVFNIHGMGVQRIPVSKVLRFEKGESALDEYERRRAALEADDADAHYRLGLWCEEQKLSREAKRQFERTLELEPDHAKLRKKLGYVQYDESWVKTEEAKKLRAARRANRAKEVDAFFKSYYLEKSRRLSSEQVWFWPPRSWRAEEFPGRPKVVLWGPVQSGVGYRITLEVLETTAPEFQKDLEARLVRDRGFRVDEEAKLEKIEPADAVKLGYIGGTEDRPIRSYHALLTLGSRLLHAEVVGAGDSPVFMEMIFSDLLSTLAYEPPPDLGKKLFDFRLPGPEWADAEEVAKTWSRLLDSATGDRKKKLTFRTYALTRALDFDSGNGKKICLKDGLTVITVRVRWRLGLSILPLEEALEHYFRGEDKKRTGRVTERRVAGRKALSVDYTLQGNPCSYCVLIKGDKLYEVIAWNMEEGDRGDRLMMSGFEGVLGSLRLP